MPLILRQVSHSYRPGVRVLTEVDLSVGRGESVAIVGPSGSGKTTLLSILGLLEAPTQGAVLLDGVRASHRGRAANRLRSSVFSWVFQSVNVLRGRSVLDNVALAWLAKGTSREQAEASAREALEAVGLLEHVMTPAQLLSGGELQRVCIARAVAARPQYLLADEPTGQLDRATSDKVLDALWNARPESMALVVATHDRRVASRCDRVLELADGHLHEDDLM